MQQIFKSGGLWVRRVEHVVLRVLSLLFSLISAHAILWFFSPLDGVDWLMPAIGWLIALCFGVLGYFDSVGERHNGHYNGHFSFQMASERAQNTGKTA